MTSGVFVFCLVFYILSVLVMSLRNRRKIRTANSIRHVTSLPLGTRFTMDDSESIWVLIHLDGCGLSVEWKGNDCSALIQKQRYIVGDEKHLRHTIVTVVQ